MTSKAWSAGETAKARFSDEVFPSSLIVKALGPSGCASLGIDRNRPYRSLRIDAPGDTSQRWIVTYPAIGGAPERILFAKQYRLLSQFGHDVVNEFRGLQVTHAAFASGSPFKAPQPYGYDAAQRVLLMEYCPSVTLSSFLFRRLRWSRLLLPAARRRQLVVYAARAGQLLRFFQTMPVPPGVMPTDQTPQRTLLQYREHFFRCLTFCKELGLSGSDLERIRSYVCDVLSLPAHGIHLVPQHSDLGPWNILVGQGHLYLVDFHNFTWGFPAYDVAYFYTALDLWSRYRTLALRPLRQAQTAFLNAFLHFANARPGDSTARGRVGGRDDMSTTSAETNILAATRLGTTQDALHLFRAFSVIHMTYFASIVLSRQRRVSHVAYLPVARRRFLREWFHSYLTGC